jgi:hypothetical protein
MVEVNINSLASLDFGALDKKTIALLRERLDQVDPDGGKIDLEVFRRAIEDADLRRAAAAVPPASETTVETTATHVDEAAASIEEVRALMRIKDTPGGMPI